MSEHPDARDLLVTARETLLQKLLPSLPQELRYEALMVANSMAVAAREAELEEDTVRAELTGLAQLLPLVSVPDPTDFDAVATTVAEANRRLSQNIRAGAYDRDTAKIAALLGHLREITRRKLAISNPKALRGQKTFASSGVNPPSPAREVGGTPGPGPRRRRIYLVRHGHVDYFDPVGQPLDPRDVSLSATGIFQVRSLARSLRDVKFDRVVASDYPRARQAAELLAAQQKIPVETDAAFREIRAGRLRDIPHRRLEPDVAYAYDAAADANGAFIGGERFADFEQRVVTAFLALLADSAWDRLLLVSHDAVNRILLCRLAGCPRSAMGAFEQDPACLDIIDVDTLAGGMIRAMLRTINFTPYDEAKSAERHTVMERVFHAYRPSSTEAK